MDNQCLFSRYFQKILIEDVTTMSANMAQPLDAPTVTQFSADTYAPGDARIPKVLGKMTRRPGVKSKCSPRKKRQ